MRLASYLVDGDQRFGVIEGDGIIDARHVTAAPTLRVALERGELPALRGLGGRATDHRLADVSLLPPIVDPGKIICVGLNYQSHLDEIGFTREQRHPFLFSRFANSHVGHGGSIVRPRVSEQLDYEGELAVIIGAPARRVDPADALRHVLGYSCYNEASVRDWQSHTSQVIAGKNFPASGAFGPWIVTCDEIAAPADLVVETRHNGEVVQHASVDDLVFSIEAIIAYCSQFTELLPGDVICTGTPAGVGAYRTPPRWLVAGDEIEVEISQIGTLRNPVTSE